MTLADLNATDREGFVAALGWIFEGSPWVAERAWPECPFPTLEDIYAAMVSVVKSASLDEQLALLRAHPDLGTLRLQTDPDISQASQREQAAAGIDALTRDQFERLRALNAAYREKFGFPFLFAVKGSTTQDILDALERRLPSTRDVERDEALRQVYRIARFRLEELIS
jgi:2-oxo-4-hydroxy-4-carboxy-5-ureidoimidazoline decarboxylase